MSRLLRSGCSHSTSTSQKCFVDFVLLEQVLILIQDPAHIINSEFPAMAWSRLLECRVRIRLLVHTRASLWFQSGGSHNSDSEQWLTSCCGMHTRSKCLPLASAVHQTERKGVQTVLVQTIQQGWGTWGRAHGHSRPGAWPLPVAAGPTAAQCSFNDTGRQETQYNVRYDRTTSYGVFVRFSRCIRTIS